MQHNFCIPEHSCYQFLHRLLNFELCLLRDTSQVMEPTEAPTNYHLFGPRKWFHEGDAIVVVASVAPLT